MNLFQEYQRNITRRYFFSQGSHAVGWASLAALMGQAPGIAGAAEAGNVAALPKTNLQHFVGKAKHVIYLHMVGGPPQMDLFDYKPVMNDWYDKDLPESVRNGQRLTTMTSGQARFPIAPINHEPAITFIQTGNQLTGRPCLGAWASYGLGSLNENLPTFVVMVAKPTNTEQVQAISARLWQSGYLSGEHAATSFRSAGDPILYINNPPGVPTEIRRKTLDGLKQLNELTLQQLGDPETRTRIENYELAFRMQTSVPELTNIASETEATLKMYGDQVQKPGTFANTVLLARRLVERGTRFVQVYINNWDTHANVAGRLPDQCRDVDQPCHALIQDLKQRGLFDDTLVIWGGEFGRTIYSQGGVSRQNYGRDHHPRCFTWWMAGGGTKGGTIYGETDDFSYNVIKAPVPIRDFHATVLHLLGFDHERFTFKYQGLDQKLTGVEHCRVVKEILA